MKKIEIYEFQAKDIENALRIVSNMLNSKEKKTCMDRDVMVALQYIRNAIDGKIDLRVSRL